MIISRWYHIADPGVALGDRPGAAWSSVSFSLRRTRGARRDSPRCPSDPPPPDERYTPPVTSPAVAIVEEDIERIRATVSIVRCRAAATLPLRRVGRNWVGLCPFHAETQPVVQRARRDRPLQVLRLRRRRATCSRSSRRSSTSTSSARSSSWPAKAGIQLRYTTRRREQGPAAPQAADRGDGARRSSGTTSACSTSPDARAGARTTCAAAAWPATSPASSSSAGRPTTGTR